MENRNDWLDLQKALEKVQIRVVANEHKSHWRQDKARDLYERMIDNITEVVELEFRGMDFDSVSYDDWDAYTQAVTDMIVYGLFLLDMVGEKPEPPVVAQGYDEDEYLPTEGEQTYSALLPEDFAGTVGFQREAVEIGDQRPLEGYRTLNEIDEVGK